MTASSLTVPLGPLTAEQNALFYGRLADFERRVVRDGSVPFASAMNGLQMLAENKFVPPAGFIPNFMSGSMIGGSNNRIWECVHFGYADKEFFEDLPSEWPKFTPRICDFVTLTVAELGYRKGAQWTTAFRAGVRYGFELCPAVAAPVVRYRYARQPLGEEIIVAMPGIQYRGHDDFVFVIEHDATGKHLHVQQAPFYGERNGETTTPLHLRGDDVLMFMRRES